MLYPYKSRSAVASYISLQAVFDLANSTIAAAGGDDKYSNCVAAVPYSDQLLSCIRWNWV